MSGVATFSTGRLGTFRRELTVPPSTARLRYRGLVIEEPDRWSALLLGNAATPMRFNTRRVHPLLSRIHCLDSSSGRNLPAPS